MPGLVCALACALLYHNMAELSSTRQGRMYWIDVTAAVKLYLDQRWPQPDAEPPKDLSWEELTPILANTTRIMTRLAERLPDRAFWRTVPSGPFIKYRRSLASIPNYQDPGRALLLAWGFGRLGGIAPYLLPWLAALAMLPILAWAIVELWTAGFPGAATVSAGLLPSSLYLIQGLALGHSAFGFYLVALVCLIAFSAYAARRAPTPVGLLVRALAAGAVLAVCVLCRSGSILLGGGFLLAILLTVGRMPSPLDWRRRAALAALACALLFAPPMAVRPSEHHPVWAGFWEGLGDFDRTKGYYWADDGKLVEALTAAGIEAKWVDLSGPKAEAFFRKKVLSDIRSDPWWYAGILGQRLVAVLFQPKLWPRAAVDGHAYASSVGPNGALLDLYYTFTPTVDLVALGDWQWELPVAAILAPSYVLLAALLAGRWLGWPRWRPARVKDGLLALVCPLVGTLALPVLLTTASAQEMQAIGLVYFLGLGLCVDGLWPGAREAPAASL